MLNDLSRGSDAAAPLFLLRPETREAPFLREHADELAGIVLLGRNLAPHPLRSRAALDCRQGDQLLKDARDTGLPFIVDPDTPLLAWLDRRICTQRFGRAGLMACARALELPARPEDFETDENLREFVVATLVNEAGATYRSAPYFRFDALTDPWLHVNLRAASQTQALLRDDAMAVFVQVGLEALNVGVLAHAAALYRDAVGVRGPVFLQVAGFDPEHTEAGALLAYLQAVQTWRAAGFEVYADRVGRFALAAVAAGARGGACGSHNYRATPDYATTAYTRSGAVRYWPAQRGDRLRREDARVRHGRGGLPACPVKDCPALKQGSGIDEIREHNVHLLTLELAEAGRDPQAALAKLAASPIGYVRAWGAALAELARRSAQV